MSFSRYSRSFQSYSYTRSDGYAEHSVSEFQNGSQTRSMRVSATAFSESNYDTDDSRSEPERSGRALSTSMSTVVSRSRRLQFHPNEDAVSSDVETATNASKPPTIADHLLGNPRRRALLGNVPFRLLASEDEESEKENVPEEDRRGLPPTEGPPNDSDQNAKGTLVEAPSDAGAVATNEESDSDTTALLSSIRRRYGLSQSGREPLRSPTFDSDAAADDDEDHDDVAVPETKSVPERENGVVGDHVLDGAVAHPRSGDEPIPSEVSELASSMRAAGYTPALQSRDIIEQYVVIADFTPDGSDVGSIALREGQIVEVLDSNSKYRWLVRTRPSKYLSPRQGWIPSSYLEKKTAETTLRSLQNIMDLESDIRSDSIEREAAQKRRAVIKEMVDTEDEFVKDMQHVVNTYLKEMDNPRMPKELRDQRDAIFLNFKEICDFHNNVLIKGLQYYAGEPASLGKTFLRLERDFDMHANYCQDEPKAQELLATAPVKEYFDEYSKRIGEIDRTLSDHLKLPIQRINDYQLLLKELIKYTARLKEDCADLQKALDLMRSIPQRAQDLKYIKSIEGFRGNIQKLGRLLRHQDWFHVTDSEGRTKERYLFLFRSSIFVTKVRKITETRPAFILKDIIRLSNVEVKDPGIEKVFEFHHKVKGHPKYPLILEAKSEIVKEAWLKELDHVASETAALSSDTGEESFELIEDKSTPDIIDEPEDNVQELEITDVSEETLVKDISSNATPIEEELNKEILREKIAADQTVNLANGKKKATIQESIEDKSKVEVLDNFEAYEELNTVMTESIQSGSITSVDAKENGEGSGRPHFRKTLKATTCFRGDTATLECELLAVPSATVAWLKDNVPLTQSEKVQFVTKGNMNYLVIKNASNEDSGLYLCKASNANGSTSCSAQLNVQEPESVDSKDAAPQAPEFSIKFKDTELLEGTSVRFLIKVHSQPEATIKFLKNDRPLKEDDRIKFITEDRNTYELAISHVTQKDAAKYTCVAKNSVGENSFTANVQVSTEKDLFPGIHEVPIINGGGFLKKGEQPEFKWFRGGQEIESSERFKVLFKDEEDTLALVFQHVKPEDAGLYTCVASTSSGRISCSAELSVEGAVKQLLRDPEAPKITATLTDTEVSEGASAMLDLKVTGYPKPKLTWLKDGTEVKAGGRFKFLHEDDESMALIIKNVTYEDAGKYVVKAKNDLGEVMTSAQLLVKIPPKFKKQMKDMAVMTDQPVKFEVEVEGQPAPEVIWYKDGQAVKESEHVKISNKKDSSVLEIKKAVPEDAGSYSCIASNTSGKISEFASLTVNDPPKILKELKSVECKESETVKFEAKVTGNPEPTVKWTFNGEEIKSDGGHIKIEKDDRNHILTINKATRKDAGKYSLSISSEIGSASTSSELSVNSLPAYIKGLSDVNVKEGETDFKLGVQVSGWPTPRIRWFIDSMEINETSKKYKIVDEGETRVLIIKKVDSECAGTYSCTISNAYGEASTKGTVNVLTKPKFTETLKDVEVTEKEDVTYNVKVTGNPTPTVKWYKDNQEVNVTANIKLSKLENGSCSLTLLSVTEENAGRYECRASNSEGDELTISRLVVHKTKHTEEFEDDATLTKETADPFEQMQEIVTNERLHDKKVKEHQNVSKIKRNRGLIQESYTMSSVQQASHSYILDSGSMSVSHEAIIEESVTDESGTLSSKIKESRLEMFDASAEGLKISEIESSMGDSLTDQRKKPLITNISDDEDDDQNFHFKVKKKTEPDQECMAYIMKGSKKSVQPENAEETIIIEKDGNKEGADENIEKTIRKPKIVYDMGDSVSETGNKQFTQENKDQSGEDLQGSLQDTTDTDKNSFHDEVKIKNQRNTAVSEKYSIEESAPDNKITSDDTEYGLKKQVSVCDDASHFKPTDETDNQAHKDQLSRDLDLDKELAHPRFDCDLKDVEVWNGMDAIIEAIGTAIPSPEVKWFKDGEVLEDGKRIKFENDGKFHRVHIASTVPEDAGVYKIQMKNKIGEASQEGHFTVKASTEALVPVLMKKLEDVVCIRGDHAHYEAKIYANPEPEVTWYKDGQEVKASDHFIISENAIKHTYNLTVHNVAIEDIGKYSVKAKNGNGEISTEASLDVQVPPEIQEIKDKKTMPSSDVSFETKVTGKPIPSVKWFKGNTELVEGNKVKLESDVVSCSYKLHLKDVKPEDGGEYACVAENVAATIRLPFNLSVTTEAPHFIKGLHSIGCKLNNPVRLDVQVYGLPMPQVKWFKGDAELEPGWKIKLQQEDERNFSLTIEQFSEEDAGKYTCKAFNQAGQAITHGDLSLKHMLPEFLKHLPKEVCIIDGEPFTLEAKLDNNPMPEVKWLKDGKEIHPDDHLKIETLPDGTVRLSVENGVPEDKGKYTLLAINDAGQESSTGHVVVEAIPKAPSFLKKLQNAAVPQGATMKLSAKVTAHPRPVAKWLKDGKPVKHDTRTRILEEPGGIYSLEIDDIKPEDEAKYTLMVSNHRGEASNDAEVTVTSPASAPEFLQPLKSIHATDGAPSRLEAKVSGSPLPILKWYKDGAPFSPDGQRVKAVCQPDGTTALLFEKTEPQDAGKYTLEATNPNGSIKSDGDLSVADKEKSDECNKAPGFVLPLRDIEVDEGKPLRFQAQIEGNPYPNITWTKDGEPLKMNESVFFSCDGNKVALEIKKASPNDAGRYECTLINPEGSARSKADASVIKLFQSPIFSQKISDLFSIPGADPRFACKVHGFPRPDVTWYFNDRPIEHDSSKYKIRRDGDLCALQIKGVTPEDRGRYKCKATNDAGEDSCVANLDIGEMGEKKERTEPPSFLKKLGDCSVMEGMTAKFTACVAGSPEPTFKWYKNDKELGESDRIQFHVEPHGLLRLTTKGVVPTDVGQYTLKISNPHGEAESTARLVFDTYEDKKPREKKPYNLIGDQDASKHPSEDDYGKDRKPRDIMMDDLNTEIDRQRHPEDELDKRRRGPDSDFDANKRPDKDSKDRHPQETSIIRSEDFDGTKKPADETMDTKVKDRMADLNIDHDKFRRSAIPLALPDKPIISKMTDRRLTLSWKPSIPIGPSMPVTYIVDMCEVPDGEWFPARSGVRGCCCEIRNLEPFRDYKFRVRVENKYGISDPSPFAITYRAKLEMTPPKQLPRLPPEFDFRPDTSPYFPKDYDIDRPLHEEYAHAPRFLRQQDDTQYAVKGEPCSVEWWVYGYPTPTVSFSFKDEPVLMGGHYEGINARNGQCKLYLSRMMDKDVGIYECTAINEHGEARQRVNLAIAEHPVFILHLDEENIMLRKSGTLQCRVIGVPYPQIKWYKDWHPIVSSNRIKIEWKEPNLCTLTINDAISKDAGLYSCCARNIAGMATTSAMVNIEENENDYAMLKYSHSKIVRAHPRPLENTYDIGDELGRGTQGIVYHAVERATGNSYAAKCMHGKGDERNWMHHELDIMNQLHDRHLIRARDGFETKNSFTIVTDLAAGGELFDNISRQPMITESEIAHYIRQILWGLEHMHGKGIAHLGLTPGDILISKPGGDDIKICDFGLANRITKGKDFYLDYGMPEFVAPEIVHHRPVSFSTDMWSVGVIAYLLLSGISPFLGENDRETLRRIQKGQLTFDHDVFTAISDEAKDFISKLLVFDPQGRLDVTSALKHPWLRFADHLGTGNELDTSRLRNYYRRYKDWVRNSACDRFYRRRPLVSAYDHPSGMVYPPGESYTPPSSPESSPAIRGKHDWNAPTFTDKVEREHEDLNYDLGYADSTSRYQNGPDTYLLQLRDVGFPLRLREYMRVSAASSPTLALKLQDTISGQAVTVRERRRFTDVMDEEIDDEQRGELDGVRRRIRSEISPRSETKNRIKELLPNSRAEEQAPYFREKLQDKALTEDQPIELSCLATGEPKPVVTWFRNDVLMSESHRVKITEDSKGRSIIRFNPAKNFDGGVYKAVARNAAGETSCRARLKQGEIPGKMDPPDVPQVSNTEALVTWHYPRVDGNTPITCYCLEYKEIEEPTWHNVASNIDHQFMVVRNLRSCGKYQFRVRASNKFGWGDYSEPSDIIETSQPGVSKVTISRAMKHQQELTESGRTVDNNSRRPSLDYSVEQNPIQISSGEPTEKYNFISEISRGRYSVVVKCCRRDGDEMFAAKLLESTPSAEASVQNEYNVFKCLRHERIPCLYDAYHYSNIFVLIQEKLQGFDVLTYLTRNHTYSESLVTRIIIQVIDALEYLHFRSIVHLDIQPDNVVVADLSNAQIKLIDFGSARVLTKYDVQKADKRGNVEYMAPEVINQEDLTVQADIWSVGVLAYILLSGVSPFRGETPQETSQNITYVRYRFEHLYKEITQEATRFLMAIFKKTPQKRPTADECLELKWLNPSDFLLKKRERAIFSSNKLKHFADEYHKQRQNVATSSESLLNAFGMHFSRSVSVEYDTLTTF